MGVVFDNRANGSAAGIASTYCEPAYSVCDATVQSYGWPIITRKVYTNVNETTGYRQVRVNDTNFDPAKTMGNTKSGASQSMPNLNTLLLLLLSAVPILAFQIITAAQLNKQATEVWREQQRRGPLNDQLRDADGRLVDPTILQIKLDNVAVETNPEADLPPPSLVSALALQTTALSVVVVLMGVLLRWGGIH